MTSVQRKVLIYVAGLMVALVLFIWLKGHFFSSGTGGGSRNVTPLSIEPGTGATHLTVDVRNANGVLQYVMRANLAKPVGGGEYQLIKPELQFYNSSGQTIFVDSDTGDVVVGATNGGGGTNQLDGIGNPYLRKGTLTGHVTITVGPVASFKRGVKTRQSSQIQMTLGRPLHFDYQQGLLISRGSVTVRGDQLQFDGSDLTVEINPANKTLEDLQILHGRRLMLSGLFHNASATPATTQSRPVSASTNREKAGAAHVQVAPPTMTTYALTFGRHVHVALGAQTMLANRLQLYFQTAAKTPATAGINDVPNSTTTTLDNAPTVKPVPTSAVAVDKTTHSPLVIHWTGPLVLRPTRHSPVVLSGSRDVFLQATGQTGNPVIMRDGTTRVGYAPLVTYDSAFQRVTMRAAAHVPVKLADTSMGSITCETLVYSNLTHHAELTGPGSFDMSGKTAGKNPWRGSWLKDLVVQLAPARKTFAATAPAIGHGKLAVKSIELTGGAQLANAQVSLQARRFTARFVQTTGNHSGSALRYFAADGDVNISSANVGLPAVDANRMACRHLVLLTHQPKPGAAPVPAELQAEDNIALTFYQKAAHAGGLPERFVITGGKLQTQLVRRTGTAVPAHESKTGNLGGSYTVGRFRIWRNTIVHIYNIGRPIRATAYALIGNRLTGTATLQSHRSGTIKCAIYQGADWLKGRTIELQRNLQQVTVPGGGELSMPEASKSAEPRVEVSWNTRMQYSAKTRQAILTGHIIAQLAGRSDQHSSLTAPAMLIHFRHRKTDRNAMLLAQLIASGPADHHAVVARDASYSKTGVLMTRMRLDCSKLEYNAVEGLLKIPAAGEMVLEDYRPATTASAAQQRGQSGFSWAESLLYHAKTGLVNLRGNVHLIFRPLKPLTLPLEASGTHANNPNSGLVLLNADELLAKLNHTGTAAKSGVDLGMGGPTRLQSVTANNALLQVGTVKLAADMLNFNAATEIAQAYGLNGKNAIISDVSGKIHGQARHIIWNLKKNKGGITVIQPTGSVNLP